ncbi:MAG: hypothetical protein K8T91_24095 [Planctomycetes bacterium]|nr:hypothetical protein [Planctomycetota bacterium]
MFTLRYRLKSLFLFVTLCCIVTAVVAQRIRELNHIRTVASELSDDLYLVTEVPSDHSLLPDLVRSKSYLAKIQVTHLYPPHTLQLLLDLQSHADLEMQCRGPTDPDSLKALAAFRNITTLDLNREKLSANDLQSIGKLSLTGVLKLDHAEFDLSDLKYLGTLRSLKHLSLPSSSFERIDSFERIELGWLSGLQALESLSLSGLPVTDDQIRGVAELKHLQDLDLGDTNVTAASLPYIAQCSRLTSLNLGRTRIGGANSGDSDFASHAKTIGKLRQLKQLALYDLKDLDNSFAKAIPFAELTKLEFVSLSDTAISDEGLSGIQYARSLQVIRLSNTKVTEAGLRSLVSLPMLTLIRADDTKVTSSEAQSLMQQRPNLEITTDTTSVPKAVDPNRTMVPEEKEPYRVLDGK